MAGIGVFCELQHGEFTKGSLGLLAEAARLGGELGEPVHALVTGEVVGRRGRGARRTRRERGPRRRGRGAAGGLAQPVVDALAALQAEHDLSYVLFMAPRSWPPTPPPAWPCASARASSSTRSSSWPRAASS